MIDWLKQKLGVTALQQQLGALEEQRQKLEKQHEALRQEHEQLQHEREELDKQLGVYRKREEADKAKYESSEPWVEIRSADFNEVRGVRIELDWNDAFVEYLKESGIKGDNEEDVVQRWLAILYQDLVQKLESKAIDRKDEEKDQTISDYV